MKLRLTLTQRLSLVFAVFLVSQGVIQNFAPYTAVTPLQASTEAQTLAMGPVASQEAIKMLGTNGGGFFNANSAHPYENPTPLSNFLQMLAIFLIPAALCFSFGREVGDQRQGWAVLAAMTVMFVIAVVAIMPAEQAGNPQIAALGFDEPFRRLWRMYLCYCEAGFLAGDIDVRQYTLQKP